MALVIDTGVLFAALNDDDPRHEVCTVFIAECRESLVIPDHVLVELDYWMRKFAPLQAWLAFCQDVAEGAYAIHHLDSAGLLRAAELQERYANIGLGLVDAAVFTTCELLSERKVATLDRRHFTILRTADGDALELLPELT